MNRFKSESENPPTNGIDVCRSRYATDSVGWR